MKQCSVLEEIVSGDEPTCGVRNRPIYSIERTRGFIIITSDALWRAKDHGVGSDAGSSTY